MSTPGRDGYEDVLLSVYAVLDCGHVDESFSGPLDSGRNTLRETVSKAKTNNKRTELAQW